MSITQLDIQDICFRMQSVISIPLLDIQSVYGVECRAERLSHSSLFNLNIIECRAEVCMILNAELNIYPTVRYFRCMFSNEELNVDLLARCSI